MVKRKGGRSIVSQLEALKLPKRAVGELVRAEAEMQEAQRRRSLEMSDPEASGLQPDIGDSLRRTVSRPRRINVSREREL